MRAIFSLVSLLLVVAIIGLLAKKQFATLENPAPTNPNNAGVALPATTPGATPQQQSHQVQQQVKEALDAAMQQAQPASEDK